MILNAFSRKWRENHQGTAGFIRIPWMHLAVTQSTTFPMNFKVLQRRENVLQNTYKHNAF